MLDYLVTHALKNVWCSPRQDRQLIIALRRMTPYGGSKNFVEVMWQREELPTSGHYYHVYAIGQNNPDRLNLDSTKGVWFNLNDISTNRALIADFYTTAGLKINPAWIWIKRTARKVFIVAIRKPDTTEIKLDTQDVFMRFYSNSFWNSERSNSITPEIKSEGLYISNPTQSLALQFRFHQHRDLPVGKAYAFVNGYYVKDFLPGDVKLGDHIHWVYDGSIKRSHDFKLSELKTFVSALDSTRKYLLHPPKALNIINYQDDVDVYIVEKRPNGKELGVYFHRNEPAGLRMVTHHDYAISVDRIAAYLNDRPEWQNNPNLYIRIHVRHSGYDRPLVDEHHRIKELYKLEDEGIIAAMVGLDSTIPEWRAAQLEASNYTRIMRSYHDDVTAAEVVDAYGYNAIAKLTADSPLVTDDQSVTLPVGLQTNSTMFEYDSEGLLLGWRTHLTGETYYTYYPETTLVEGVVGLGGMDSSIQIGNAPVTLNPNQSYSFYVSTIVAGTITQQWIDVTDDTSYYQINDGVVTWKLDPDGQIGAVKGNSHFVSYDLTLPNYSRTFQFSINHTPVQGTVLRIPPGRIDIYLNGRALQEGLDYVVQFPDVVITNKEYLNLSLPAQQFTVRCTGFAEKDLSRIVTDEKGFVVHQLISVNSTYDIRDDKVKRIVVDGRTFHRDSLKFEEHQRLVELPNIADGRPYFIEDVVVPVRGISAFNTYVLRQRSLAVDKRVSDYLSSKIPEPVFPEQPQIPTKYWVYSPLTAKLIFDLSEGFLTPTNPTAPESEVADKMSAYLDWLYYDPCLKDDLDLRFVSIHPHPEQVVLSLNRDSYLFLERVIRLYLRNRVDLTAFVSIAD